MRGLWEAPSVHHIRTQALDADAGETDVSGNGAQRADPGAG